MTIELGAELDRHFRLLGVQAVAHDDGVILRRGGTRVFLAGDGVIEMLDQLVEASRAGGISETRLKKTLPPQDWPLLEGVMEALTSRRLLVAIDDATADADPGAAETPEDVYYWEFGATRAQAHERLARCSVPVIGDNAVSRHLVRMLQASGLSEAYLVDHPQFRGLGQEGPAEQSLGRVEFEPWAESGAPDRAEIFVVCSDFGGLALMREWNEYCHGAGTPFLPVVLQDHVAYIGPPIIPGVSPCFECLYLRQNSSLEDVATKRATEHAAFFGQHANGYLAPMASAAADFAAMELIKHLTQLLPGGNVGTLVELDLAAPSIETRKVLKAPFCPVCSATTSYPAPAAEHVVFMPGNDAKE